MAYFLSLVIIPLFYQKTAPCARQKLAPVAVMPEADSPLAKILRQRRVRLGRRTCKLLF